MANISIPNLALAGSELFSDNESYMTEIIDRDFGQVKGGHHLILFDAAGKPVARYHLENAWAR
jgi:hypothetical protein